MIRERRRHDGRAEYLHPAERRLTDCMAGMRAFDSSYTRMEATPFSTPNNAHSGLEHPRAIAAIVGNGPECARGAMKHGMRSQGGMMLDPGEFPHLPLRRHLAAEAAPELALGVGMQQHSSRPRQRRTAGVVVGRRDDADEDENHVSLAGLRASAAVTARIIAGILRQTGATPLPTPR